jgi:hypothetical protein
MELGLRDAIAQLAAAGADRTQTTTANPAPHGLGRRADALGYLADSEKTQFVQGVQSVACANLDACPSQCREGLCCRQKLSFKPTTRFK